MTDQSEPIASSKSLRPTFVDIFEMPPSPGSAALATFVNQHAHARAVKQEATGRARLEWVALLFDASRRLRHRFDPRRLGDRFVARACRGWITRSERAGAAAQAKREATP